jgi:anti-sigma28 factor (negative regulator of flagellin synthesis)
MSIRIYNDGLAGAAAAETSRAEQLSRATGTGKSAAGQGASGEDQVQISSLSEAVATAQSQRAASVQRLAAVYQSGGYQVDSTSVSRALVDHALAAGGMEIQP